MRWYTETYGPVPRCEHVLEALASTPTERQRILRDFFRPGQEEREEGTKLPSAVHRSIAQLAADGRIQIVVTLNSDRLVEQARREAGVDPTRRCNTRRTVRGGARVRHAPKL